MAAAADGKEERDTVCDYRAGQPVWYRHDKKTGWWPCMVLQVSEDGEKRSVDLKALGDDYPYGWVEIGLPKLKPFVSPGIQSIVQEQIKRLQKKHKTDLRNFVAAVRESLQHFPLFKLDVELPSDKELGAIATPVSTPRPAAVWKSFLYDSEIFTPGTDSRGDTGGSVTRSQRRLRQRPTTPTECRPVATTAEKTRSDILAKVVRRRSGRKKQRQCSTSPYSNSGKRSKREEEGEGEWSGADCDIRRRLDLEESTDDAVVDILTICESNGDDTRECAVGRGEGRENGECGERGRCGAAVQNGNSGRECGNGRVSKNSEVLNGTLTLSREGEETSVGETTEEGRKEEPVSRMESGQNKEGTDEPRQKKARVKEAKSAKRVKKLEKKREKEEKEEKKREDEKEREKERGEEDERGGEKTTTTEEEGSETSSEDDELPNYQTTSTTKVIINELKEGDYIWSKWKTFPHWPALVVKGYPAKTKSKARARIVYFGDNPKHPVTIKYAQRRKLARYVRGNEEYEEFMRAGRECGENAKFLQSVQEAEAFITAKCNKELTGSALEMFKQICEKRPASMTPPAAWMEQSLSFRQHEPPTVSAFGFRLDRDLMDREKEEEATDSEASKTDSEEEEENSVYTLEKVLQHFTKLKPALTAIMSGATPSEYHTAFTSGTAKQKQQLALCSKYGPCKKWTILKKMELIRHLQKIAEESFNSSLFRYAGDVLLPEAMVRTISHFEGISEEEAQKRL